MKRGLTTFVMTLAAIAVVSTSASAQLVIQIPNGMRQGEQAAEQRTPLGCSVSKTVLDGPDGPRTIKRTMCTDASSPAR
jgi:hypothetical protein